MKDIKLFASRFMKDESGQNLIEYALVVALIALVSIAAMGSVGQTVAGAFIRITNSINNSY